MNETFITLLLFGSIKDPILWILGFIIGSGLIIKKNTNIYLYLCIAGFIWSFIRLYIYKALGESFDTIMTLQLIFVCWILMLLVGLFFKLTISYIKQSFK
tara:strand:+ start:2927 stop:3226 length:300 start_codon:yes stop_codon:yes gene_type:complete